MYADWQDEHGQPEHGELIRVMVELAKARKQDKPSKERRTKLLARMKELFKTPALKPLRKLETDTWKYDRGFIRDLTLRLVDQLARRGQNTGEVLISALPDLPSVVPFDKLSWLGVILPEQPTAEHAAALAAVPWLKRVDRMEMSRWDSAPIRSGVLAPLVASKHLGGLLYFLHHGPIAASELVSIYRARSATSLRGFPLRVAQRGATPDSSTKPSRKAFLSAVEQIVSAKRAKQFTSFGNEIVDVDESLAKILLASKHLKNVREFRYVFDKATAKTQAAFVERFGLPEKL